ncbi:hypothetical protein DFP73DRAFT_616316 [Morchella snyderi]|nr:hypothetical protein DFP73DRAFT_616316 [Morchella snyderi]
MSSVCAYPVSGNYGIAPQNLNLILLLLGTVWHRKAWFAEAMLGGAMVYSSVAAVHALSTIHFDPPPVAELDAIPIYGVIYFALCVSPWVLIWSQNFRREFLGTRAVVFSWMMVIMDRATDDAGVLPGLDEEVYTTVLVFRRGSSGAGPDYGLSQ